MRAPLISTDNEKTLALLRDRLALRDRVALLVEDNREWAEQYSALVQKLPSWECHHVFDLDQARDVLAIKHIDLILLDRDLGFDSGDTLLSELREAHDKTPIIMLTNKDMESEEQFGLVNGADDYVSKRSSSALLVARIEALMRRTYGAGILRIGRLEIDFVKDTVIYRDKPLILTPQSKAVLQYLAITCPKSATVADLIGALWPDIRPVMWSDGVERAASSEEVRSNRVGVEIATLRAALDTAGVGREALEDVEPAMSLQQIRAVKFHDPRDEPRCARALTRGYRLKPVAFR